MQRFTDSSEQNSKSPSAVIVGCATVEIAVKQKIVPIRKLNNVFMALRFQVAPTMHANY